MKHFITEMQPAIDHRFRDLLGDQAWFLLPPAIRRRFGKRLKGGSSVTYQGQVVTMRMTAAGWCFAQLVRLIGSPLPYDRSSAGQAAVVVVTEDQQSDGQFWVRQYGRAQGFPQVVHSSKRFDGPTGLEEYIGYGVGMALLVEATDDALYFKSAGYFIQLRGRKFRLPKWLTPGALVIGHHDMGDSNFLFSLHLSHPFFGEMIAQDCVFQDAKE
ncbi:DUF4166 domain-containing protein [Pseudaestuariivita rosea]|uniref:DUF4166 domain-containing protein n=1 Tax=Pseudaestuariivita rosea TaxID=2763263 RepID=UPI001ABA147C|nr:DUF4166 domain-containing protein [Pseudaestuariivita rosea]